MINTNEMANQKMALGICSQTPLQFEHGSDSGFNAVPTMKPNIR